MRDPRFIQRVSETLEAVRRDGLLKPERLLVGPQGARTRVLSGDGVEIDAINLCANNYLGLANDPRVIEAARAEAASAGAGFASVRFICGTHELHKRLEADIADYLGYEDAILFAAAFDANAAIFESLLDEQDAVVSDSLNHASIIDGVRLSKAKRYRFANGDLADLEANLSAARDASARTILIATDGVFSMDGYLADLPGIIALAERFGALVMIDDCHATGVIGPQGKGVAAHYGLEGQVDILTGTFGKALGGAMGGFIAARRDVVDLLRQRARPYLFSNALAPAVCGAALEAIRIARGPEGDSLRAKLGGNAETWRSGLAREGFELNPGEHPIVPVLLGEAHLAQTMARDLLGLGVFVTGFSYPVVPRGQARIRTQLSAGHTAEDLDLALRAFVTARKISGVPQ